MDMDNIEEMPYHHSQEEFTKEQEQEIIDYCKNDVLSTYKFYLYTIGDVSNAYYKGKNKIQDRIDLISELDSKYPSHGFSVNYSDSKIGDELNKLTYMELAKITDKRKLNELKKSRKPTRRFRFGDCIPNYVSFKTAQFRTFHEKISGEWVIMSGKGKEYDFSYNGTKYTIAQGGIHSNETKRILKANNKTIIRDADVGLTCGPTKTP